MIHRPLVLKNSRILPTSSNCQIVKIVSFSQGRLYGAGPFSFLADHGNKPNLEIKSNKKQTHEDLV